MEPAAQMQSTVVCCVTFDVWQRFYFSFVNALSSPPQMSNRIKWLSSRNISSSLICIISKRRERKKNKYYVRDASGCDCECWRKNIYELSGECELYQLNKLMRGREREWKNEDKIRIWFVVFIFLLIHWNKNIYDKYRPFAKGRH